MKLPYCVPRWLRYFSLPLTNEGSRFLHVVINTCFVCFYNSRPNGYEVIAHCSFGFNFHNNYWSWPFLSTYWPFVYLLGENVYSSPLPIFKCCCCCYWVVKDLYVFWILVSYQIQNLRKLSPILCCLFNIVQGVVFFFSIICAFGFIFKKSWRDPKLGSSPLHLAQCAAAWKCLVSRSRPVKSGEMVRALQFSSYIWAVSR